MYKDYEDENFDEFEDFSDELSEDEFDDLILDMDFSNLSGKNFKDSLKKTNRAIKLKKREVKTDQVKRRPLVSSKRRPVVVPAGKKRELPRVAQKPLVRQEKKRVKPTEQPIQKRVQPKIKTPQLPAPKALAKPKLVKPIRERSPLAKTRRVDIPVSRRALIDRQEKKISRILVPEDKKVIVEGVNKFILSRDKKSESIKNIGYYKGKKLKQMVLIFNNITPNPFTIELFNPSAPLDYLYNTSQNLNNRIEVSGNQVAYSDILFSILANPLFIANCKFTFSGPNLLQQRAVPLQVIDREVTGTQLIQPLNIDLQVDTLQVQNDVVFFDITEKLNRPFIPDGMDVVKYTILPNMSVVMGFFYYQIKIKNVLLNPKRKKRK